VIPGPFSNPRISGLKLGLKVSKKTANLLAYKFLQAVFLSVK